MLTCLETDERKIERKESERREIKSLGMQITNILFVYL